MQIRKQEKIALIVVTSGVVVLVTSLSIYFFLGPQPEPSSIPGEFTSIEESKTVTPIPDLEPFNWPKPDRAAVSDVRIVNGIPRLFIHNVQVPPVMFFGNTEIFARMDVVTSQVEKASNSNIHLHSITTSPPIGEDHPPEVQHFNLENQLDAVLKGDPDGYILLRVNVGKFYNTGMYPQSEIVDYVTKRFPYNPMVSIASDLWFEDAKKMFADMIEFIRDHPVYSKHVIGYHLECDEWFQHMHRENGVDISPANSRKFRQWLTDKYKTDSALKNAWNDPTATLAGAKVPEDLPGNLNGVPEDRTLMLDANDRRYIDYLDYIGELVTDRIEGFAKLAKDITDNESIVITFYGYHFELTDPRSGHFNLDELLESEYLDGFASPKSYMDRSVGGLFPATPPGSTGAFISPIDTIHAAGKLWFVESDQRTFINRYNAETEHDAYLKPMDRMEDILEVSKRSMGINMIKSTAIWYMDLWSVGWLDDQEIWDTIGKVSEVYHAYAKTRTAPSKPRVAFVVDEKSQSLVAQPTDSAIHFLFRQRYDFYRAGIKWGMHTTKDLFNGNLDDMQVIVMLNPYRFDQNQIDKIQQAARGKTIVFVYGFGELSQNEIKTLTGMDIEKIDDTTSILMTPAAEADALGLQDVESLGVIVNANPRWAVKSGADENIGMYDDGKIGFAVKDNGDYKAVFYGGMRMSTEVIRAIVEYSGNPHIFLETDDVSAANEDLLVVHSSRAGVKTLTFPERCDIYDYFEDRWYTDIRSIQVHMEYGETRYFFYGKKSQIESWNIPKW